jgi:hypothetical protein
MDWLIWIQLLKSNLHLFLETPISDGWRRTGPVAKRLPRNVIDPFETCIFPLQI